ncbi:secretory lipase [Phyllosticta citrichinensis]|uniref:Secretory lipase n=1 Tax=Phyllosticta citrichinensis TaxID=1130410 RepID=A0ABR1XIG5_9PEZI
MQPSPSYWALAVHILLWSWVPSAAGQRQAPPHQQRLPGPQCEDWNSEYRLSEFQIAAAGLSETTTNNVNVALNFERTNWATGPVAEDPFYTTVPQNSTFLPPGSLLKVEDYTNISLYTVPPNLALSRIMYQTLDFKGFPIPTSAYVLWPFHPREVHSQGNDNSKNIPVVVFAHGTSGIFPESAPSHIRNLWFQYSAPFTLALQGYAVVAPDYAGLGVPKTYDGEPIPHLYFTWTAQGNDILYAAHAAHKAFPDLLSKEYVTMGHSQGGGAVWAASTTLQNWTVSKQDEPNPIQDFLTSNYLGAIPAAPGGSSAMLQAAFSVPDYVRTFAVGSYVAHGASILTNTPLTSIFTPAGLARYELSKNLQAANSVIGELFNLADAAPSGFWLRKEFAAPGGPAERILMQASTFYQSMPAGPLLVMGGSKDQTVPAMSVAATVEETCKAFGEKLDLEYAVFDEVQHVPVLYSGQRVWLNWIHDRFKSVKGEGESKDKAKPKGCNTKTYKSVRQADHYSQDLLYSLSYVQFPYQIA